MIGSKEERIAVLEAYVDAKGSMDVIFERVMVSSVLDDEERFVKVIQEAIEAGEVEAFKNFTHESKTSKKRRRKQAEGERKEAEEYAKEIGVYDQLFGKKNDEEEHEEEEEEYEKKNEKGKKGKRGPKAARKKVKQDDTSALETLIKNRSKDRVADFMANLEAKYVTGADETRTKSKDGRKHKSEPTEAEFEAARQRMASNSREKTTKDVSPQRRSKRVRK
jgi:DnaJ family protein C protein 9